MAMFANKRHMYHCSVLYIMPFLCFHLLNFIGISTTYINRRVILNFIKILLGLTNANKFVVMDHFLLFVVVTS